MVASNLKTINNIVDAELTVRVDGSGNVKFEKSTSFIIAEISS